RRGSRRRSGGHQYGLPRQEGRQTGAGAALLRDPGRAARVLSAVRLACPVPLSVKIRAGWQKGDARAFEIARIAEDCGVDALTIHPRYASQGFSGYADWALIGNVKEHSGIPVIGNGDVSDPSLALKMRQETGCDAVMIGRAAVGNPWIFDQTLRTAQGLPILHPDLPERRSLIMEHFGRLADTVGEYRAALAMRGLLLWYTRGLPHSSRFRGALVRIRDLDSLIAAMDDYFGVLAIEQECESPRMPPRRCEMEPASPMVKGGD
ncbi:MAG: tRNA-dihydrouridine synthase, partial [Deltaproteobacteria bacterium]|nr:tRNA-dihydrouridine synthase [Deltaproteobacteria bacterium]